MMRKHVPAMCVVCQTKVSKLIVQIGGDEYDHERRTSGTLQDAPPVTQESPSGGNSFASFGTCGSPQRQEKLVQLCSWTDRRESGVGIPKSSIAESADDVHHCMPSVRELAKQFSSKVSATEIMLLNKILVIT